MQKISLRFTLLEVVVAMAIIALSTSIAVSVFRGESPARALDNAFFELQSFCSQVRFRASEDGREWAVYFNAEKRTFMAQCLLDPGELEIRDSGGDVNPPPPRLYWRLAERFEIETPDFGDDGLPGRQYRPKGHGTGNIETAREVSRSIEEVNEKEESAFSEEEPETDPDEQEFGPKIFRFYADGSAGGASRLILKCGELSKVFELSPLTGRMIAIPDEEENGAVADRR